MYVRNRSKKRKYLIVKLFGTRSCDGSLYVCCCRYNGCINRRDVHISMYCHERFQESRLVVATNIRTTCSFIWFVCKRVVFASAWDTHIPMIFAFDDLCVTSNMSNNFYFQWLVCTQNDVVLD